MIKLERYIQLYLETWANCMLKERGGRCRDDLFRHWEFYLVDHVKRIEIAIVCKIEHDF